jgi:hypothetical protein
VAQAKARPYLKNKLSKKVWGCTSSGRVPGPQFKPSYHQKKKKKKEKSFDKIKHPFMTKILRKLRIESFLT